MNRPLKIALGLLLVGAVADRIARYVVHQKVYDRQLTFLDEPPPDALMADRADGEAPYASAVSQLEAPSPLREIEPLDDEAHNWSNPFSSFASAGATVADLNGDGLPDLYLSHDGQNWTRASDDNAVLLDTPRFTSNVLYINQGNDAQGDPIFARLDELAAANDTFVKEELLVEGYLYPRESLADSTERPGRNSNTTLAADFNGDGTLDLLVGNSTEGSFWSSPPAQRVLNRFVDPMGREARQSKTPVTSLINHFIEDYQAQDGISVTRESARGTEPEAANSLYLNMGDADGDGLPEWRDASREAGLEGKRTTLAVLAADIDLDGDLDIYEANVMDPDFWPGGATGWAGAANALFVNQLAQTGELRFEERGAEYGVDGLFDEAYPQPELHRLRKFPVVPIEYSMAFMQWEEYRPEMLSIHGDVSEPGEISWSSIFQDVNDDGYPDIWVANDLGLMRLYLNQGGLRFVDTPHARYHRSGMWMTLAGVDLDGDLKEDLVAGNMGGNMLNHSFVVPDFFAMREPVITDSMAIRTLGMDRHDPTHAIINGADIDQELAHRVHHSRVLPPDTTLPSNVRTHGFTDLELPPFDPSTIDPYEFAWGMTVLDLQNDGRQDLYWHGCLYNRGGGLFPVMGSDPGRLLVNATEAPGGDLQLVDLTAEHHAFNIEELQYDRLESEGYIYRKSPQQNWRKRDTVNSYDRSVWVAQGAGIQERMTNHDLIQTSENGRAAVGADLNGDGFADLLLTNLGGYDSRRSDNQNLKAMLDGRPQVVPPPDYNFPTLTNFEPGRTRVFMNTYTEGAWLKVDLVDDAEGSFNRNGVGARVVVNDKHLLIRRAGSGGFLGNVTAELLFGMGEDSARSIEVTWPDAARTVTRFELDGLSRGTLVLSKTDGVVSWRPIDDGLSQADTGQ